MDLSSLGAGGIKDNHESYIQSFSKDAREIFEHFKFGEFIAQLGDANLLYKAVQQVKGADLRPEVVSNHDMGLVFEELIRRLTSSSIGDASYSARSAQSDPARRRDRTCDR